MSQKREDFRIEYQEGDGPTLILEAGIYQILELSASGLRFKYSGPVEPLKEREEPLKIVIKFPNKNKDSRIQVQGKYLRSTEDYCVLQFHQQIPSKIIFDEQFRLKKKRHSSQG